LNDSKEDARRLRAFSFRRNTDRIKLNKRTVNREQAVTLFGSSAIAHDSWISAGKFRSPAGEHCCGDHDWFVVALDNVRMNGIRYDLLLLTIETVPFRETLPSQDGHYWRCQRPDGSRGCFFAPPPAT
jgi:hypothetical protein